MPVVVVVLATLETQTHTHPCPLQLSYRLRSTLFPFVLTNASPAHKYNPNNYKLTTLTTIQVFTPKDRYIKRWGGVTGLSTCITKIQQKTKLGNNKPCSSSMTSFHSEECNKYTRWGGKDQHNTIISKRLYVTSDCKWSNNKILNIYQNHWYSKTSLIVLNFMP